MTPVTAWVACHIRNLYSLLQHCLRCEPSLCFTSASRCSYTSSNSQAPADCFILTLFSDHLILTPFPRT